MCGVRRVGRAGWGAGLVGRALACDDERDHDGDGFWEEKERYI